MTIAVTTLPYINGPVHKWFKKWENIPHKILRTFLSDWSSMRAEVLTEAVSGRDGKQSEISLFVSDFMIDFIS